MKNKIIINIIIDILFIALTLLIAFDYIIPFDNMIYNLITFNINSYLTTIFKVITFLGSTPFMIFLTIFLFIIFLIKRKNIQAYLVAGTIILSTIINNIIKIIIRRPRPNVIKLVIENSYSFPSGHTMAAVTMYGLLFYLIGKMSIKKSLKKILRTFLVILPILIGISRIYLGAHFASDVIGAYLLSTSILLVVTYLVDKNRLL